MDFASDLIIFREIDKGEIPLHKLPKGKSARVKSLINDGLSRRRLLDLGLIPNTVVKTERLSPSGNPVAYNIRGSVIALRKEESKNVIVEILNE